MKGILFNYELGLFDAVIQKKKWKTRRMINPQPPADFFFNCEENGEFFWCEKDFDDDMMLHWPDYYDGLEPRYKKGEKLYLKEPYYCTGAQLHYKYESNGNSDVEKWENKLFMPEKYARYFIIIKDVTVERLNDISEEDAIAEGVGACFQMNAGYPDYLHLKKGVCELTQDTAKSSFISLWEKINGKNTWRDNPWVWVYEFEFTIWPNIK